MRSMHWLGTVSLLIAIGCSGTDRAKNDAREANKEVAKESTDVKAAAQQLAEEEGELREAQLEADAKAAKLDNQIAKDTASRKKP